MTLEELQQALEELQEEKEILQLNVNALEEDLGGLELMLIEMLAKAPLNTYAIAQDNYYLYSAEDYTISRLDLHTQPIIGNISFGIGGIVSTMVKQLPNIPRTILEQPIRFAYTSWEHDGEWGEATSTVTATEVVAGSITSYKHSVAFAIPQWKNDDIIQQAELEFLVVTKPSTYIYDEAEDGRFIVFNHPGVYYLDKLYYDFFISSTDITDENVSITPNVTMLFDVPITIPVSGISQNKMENYINETILGGKW